MSSGRFSLEFVQSFMGRLVEQSAPGHAAHLGPCRVWTGATSREGHGHVSVNGVVEYTHRVAFEIVYGREPVGLLRHLCGVHACASERHLREGDDASNFADTVKHGRYSPPPHPCGQSHPSAKLSDVDIAHLWTMHEHGYTQTEIADALHISQSAVSQILGRKYRTCRRR